MPGPSGSVTLLGPALRPATVDTRKLPVVVPFTGAPITSSVPSGSETATPESSTGESLALATVMVEVPSDWLPIPVSTMAIEMVRVDVFGVSLES